MPDPVEGFKNLLKDKKIAIKFHYIEQFEKCFLRWKKISDFLVLSQNNSK
jgi:hypothetical protein